MIPEEPCLVPVKRPHFHLDENDLYFLISRRPHCKLTDKELLLWHDIDGERNIASLKRAHSNAAKLLATFWEKQIIELAEPYPLERRRKILVIEPHMDDAILSIGGIMWQRRHECKFEVVSVTGISNFTSYHKIDRDYFDTETVTQLRRQESNLALRLVGGTHRVLDQLDAPLRYQRNGWSVNWYKQHRRSISAFVNHSIPAEQLESWRNSVTPVLLETDAEEIWMPLGIGSSADHEATRNACLTALIQNPEITVSKTIRYYYEVPYAINFKPHIAELLEAHRKSGSRFEKQINNISEALPMKQRLISIFASQFKMNYMAPKVEATAAFLATSEMKYGEPLLKIINFPKPFHAQEFSFGHNHIKALNKKIPNWYARNQNARHLALLCPGGFGYWAHDIKPILKAFSNTKLKVYLPDDGTATTNRFTDPRIKVIQIPPHNMVWLKILITTCFSLSQPAVLFTGRQLYRRAPWIRIALCLSQSLVLAKPEYFSHALKQLHSKPK